MVCMYYYGVCVCACVCVCVCVCSWDIGLLHIISLCTEFYFDSTLNPSLVEEQHKWLQADLEKANEPAQRAKHPWVISLGHRPMYCTTYGYDDCNRVDSKVSLPCE